MKRNRGTVKKLEPLSKAQFPSEAAILLDYDSHWALRIKPVNDPLPYSDYGQKLYRSLERIGINADVISCHASWERYKVLLLPAAFILDEDTRAKLREYVGRRHSYSNLFNRSEK